MKKFNTRDGKGIELVKQEGIKVMFLTSENISIVEKRANKLNIDFLFMGIKNKRQKLDEFFKANTDFGYEKTIYIGDDANDQDCIKQCGFSAVPSDANKAVILYADYVCALAGGSGCVREVCDFIIAGRKHE